MVILINFQKLIFFNLNETISSLWVVIIIIFYIRILFKKMYNSLIYNISYYFIFIFMLYILFHFIFISLDNSLSNGMYSLSYILFFPIIFFLLELKINTMLKLIAHLLIVSGLIQAIGLFMDMFVLNEPLFKIVTPSEGIVRYYGISISVVALGIQLASGALMSLGLYFKTNRVFYLTLFFIFLAFLYKTNVRAPLY